jgi:hypothetical protein
VTVRTVASLAAALLLFGQACDRHDARAGARPEAVGPSSSSVAGSVATPSARADDDAASVRRVVQTWSAALDRHDVGALASLYGEHVRFYGHDLTREAVIGAKRDALRAQPAFRQSIVGDIDVAPSDGGSAVATFTKRSGQADKMRSVQGRLVLETSEGGPPTIVEETDEASNARRAATERTLCEDVAARAVGELPSVKRAVADAQHSANQAGGNAHYGSITPIEDDDGFTVELGVHTPDRFESAVSYSVDRAGHLTVTVLEENVNAPAETLRAVARACQR